MNSTKMALPWYKEFGVWMLLAPLLLIFVVCSILVGFAVSGADDRITDDYYKEGKMINNRFAAENLAKELGISAEINVNFTLGNVLIDLQANDADIESLSLAFSHPAKAGKDHVIELYKMSPHQFKGELRHQLTGRWYLRLEPAGVPSDKSKWRLAGENDFTTSTFVKLD